MAGRWNALGAAVLAVLPPATLSAAQSRAATPRLMVFYVEAPPAKAASAAKALTDYAAKVRGDADREAPVIDVLSESGRPSRMALVEQWRNLTADGAALQARALQGALAPILQAPIDDRLGDPLVPLNFTTAPTGVFQVLMHIDVMPDGAPTAAKAVTAQKARVLAAPGALAFQAATQTGRPNHFTVHEVWKSRADYEAYAASPAGQELRRRLTPFKGAPFDDRYYGR